MKKPSAEKPRSTKYEPLYPTFEENNNLDEIQLEEAVLDNIHKKHDPNQRPKTPVIEAVKKAPANVELAVKKPSAIVKVDPTLNSELA